MYNFEIRSLTKLIKYTSFQLPNCSLQQARAHSQRTCLKINRLNLAVQSPYFHVTCNFKKKYSPSWTECSYSPGTMKPGGNWPLLFWQYCHTFLPFYKWLLSCWTKFFIGQREIWPTSPCWFFSRMFCSTFEKCSMVPAHLP